MKTIEGCELRATNINYTIPTPKPTSHPFKIWSKEEIESNPPSSLEQPPPRRTPTNTRHVLKNVSIVAKPHEILAVVGPSGAGKSTLLQILAGKLIPTTRTTSIHINQTPVSNLHFNKICGFVMQHDALFPLLTVKETLLFSAKLKLGHHHSNLTALVETLIQELGLVHVASTRVGASDGKIRGISGGERRRVSIGVEAVHNPRILILDEPTSGLDSASAIKIVERLKAMAEGRGRTVVMSIHQPGFRIVKMFGTVLVLADGSVVHQGSVDELQVKLSSVGLEVPVQVNVVEFAMDCIEMLRQEGRREEKSCDWVGERGQVARRRCTLQQLFQQNKVILVPWIILKLTYQIMEVTIRSLNLVILKLIP